MRHLAVDTVTRWPARVQTKLLVAFLAMVVLLILLGAVGLRVLGGMSQQTEELIGLQRKIAAYRHVQHDTTRQLYGVSSAMVSQDERELEAALRQLSQFGYDLDRLQHVARDEAELLGEVRRDYDRFIEIVTRAVELARAGRIAEAREVQLSEARPLADRLERLTNQLVNVAEVDMLERTEASQHAYAASRTVVIAFALGSIVLALGLGYVFSWSIVGPVIEIEARLRRIAAGDFSQRVRVANRDELGALAADVNRTSEELGRLYGQIEERTRRLERSVRELETLGEVSRAVNSTLELGAVLRAIAAHAVTLAEADAGAFCAYDETDRVFRLQATHELDRHVVDVLTERPVRLGEGAVGLAGLRRRAVQIPDIDGEPGYALYDVIRRPGYRALLAVPLLRDDALVGGLVLCRKTPGAFAPETVDLVQTLANQSVLAIQNAELFEEIERKGQELAAASRHKSQFLANMSHELRTPLNAIIGFTRLVMRRAKDVLPERQYENLGKILASAEHLLALINAVLDLSKIEAGRTEVHPSEFALEPLVDQCLRTVEPMVRADRVRLVKEIEPDLPALFSDEDKLRQILINLLANAVKFTEAGSITVCAQRRGDGAVALAVRDTGIGIPEDALGLIFEEFRQVDGSSTRPYGGTGLGLAISRRLARLIGGDITVESAVGLGSTFTVTLPIRYDAAPVPGAAVAVPAEGRPPSEPAPLRTAAAAGARDDGARRLVLAIDDDPNMIYLLRENLAEAGYEVAEAAGGDEGVGKARELRPEVIVLDILMSRKDGWQVLHELKTDPATRDIPVVVLSIVDQKELGYRLGAFDYLLKPLDRDALLRTLARLAPPHHRVLVVDDDPAVADLVRQLLEPEGYAVEAARDGNEALARLARTPPDVLLLDLLMPGLDGFGVLQRLQDDSRLGGLPVVVLTAKDLSGEERALLRRRARAVVEKRGLSREMLLREVRRVLPAYERRQPGGSPDGQDHDRRGRRGQPRPAGAAS